MKNFSEFMNDIKNNRESEMHNVRNKGYSLSGRNYKYSDNFLVEFYDCTYEFGLFKTNNDIVFLLVKKKDNLEESAVKKEFTYFSMKNLFDQIYQKDIAKIFLNSAINKNRELLKLYYKNSIYALESPVFTSEQLEEIKKKDSFLLNVFLLFILIQNKSNVIFVNNQEYIDGIYRFFYVYSLSHLNHPHMTRRGWSYNGNGFQYKTFMEMDLIRIEFYGKEEMAQERIFTEKIKDMSTNEEVLDLFLEEYGKKYGKLYARDDVITNSALFHTDTTNLHEKEISRCDSLKTYKKDKKDKPYTTNALTIGFNQKSHLYMLDKFNKKYYLTENELDEIIKSDPSMSSAYGRSEGSTS